MNVQIALTAGVTVMKGVNGDCVWLDNTMYSKDNMACSTITIHFKSIESARAIAEEILRLTSPAVGA